MGHSSSRWRGDPLVLPMGKGDRLVLDRKSGSPDPDDPEAVGRWLESQKRPLAVDLFAGGGGLSLGLEEAGFKVVAAADTDSLALETHSANLGTIYVGGAAVAAANGYRLLAGETVFVAAHNVNDIWLDATVGAAAVSWLAS